MAHEQGGSGDDVLDGTGSDDTLRGGGGDDSLQGGDGDDLLVGDLGDDSLDGGSGDDRLLGGSGDDSLDGGDGNDDLSGGSGHDTMNGDAGDDRIAMLVTRGDEDTIDAGVGDDTLVLSGKVSDDHVVVVDLSQADQVVSIGGVADSLTQSNFEHLDASRIGGSLDATGSSGDDLIIGSNSDDSLDGSQGADDLSGGRGDDSLEGGDGDDSLNGGSGNDLLDGGTGDDDMRGGMGNDTYVVDSQNDHVTESLNAGRDKVMSSIDYTLTKNVENLELTGSAGLMGTGNQLNNVLTGNSGNNQLSGEGGHDLLSGGAGDDSLNGGSGNDLLDGGTGDDDMQGGLGNDTYVVDSQNDLVTEAVNAGRDKVMASTDYTLTDNVEYLELTGGANLAGTGNQLNNVITGNSGNNQLDGGAGRDRLAGGLGDDTYTVDLVKVGKGAGTTVRPEDVVIEGRNQGSDTVILRGVEDVAKASTLTLGANLEQLDASQTGDTKLNLMGNVLDNTVTGNDADNILFGLNGDDILRGGLGNDTVNGGNGNDTFLFGSGDGQDTIRDNSGTHDTIAFDSGINPLDLVISRQANDLRLAIHGSADQITVKNWFVGTTNQTETIQAGNGQELLNTHVNQLIQAMAQFTTDTGVSWDAAAGGAGDQTQFQGIIAAAWQ